MIKCDYIEEAGQHYCQCVIEVNNMKLVDPATLLNIPNVMMIVKKRRSGKKTVINFLN
jgi:hypothetical protein